MLDAIHATILTLFMEKVDQTPPASLAMRPSSVHRRVKRAEKFGRAAVGRCARCRNGCRRNGHHCQ